MCCVDGELVYLDTRRIVMPFKGVKPILKLLHVSHVGVNKTYDLARSIYYWPGMLNDIKQMIDGCKACHSTRPAQPVNPRSTKPPSSSFGAPMSHVGVDLFEFGGHQHLACVDQWSGYPMYQKLTSTTSSAIIKVLTGWFNTLGWPNVIRSDGGPQFRSEFVKFCEENGIMHELSSPYSPRSNGLAESGDKIVKTLLQKCLHERGDMQRVLYEWRNMPKSHGFSPAQLLFGRSQNMLLPQPQSAFSPIDFHAAAVARDQLFSSQADHYNRDKVPLEERSPGMPVHVQQESTGLWDLTGVIIEARPDKLSYLVEIDGRIFVRGRNKLKPVSKLKDERGVPELDLDSNKEEKGGVSVCPDSSQASLQPTLRRSQRLASKESCKSLPFSSCSSLSGSCPDTGPQHVPYSYSVPCPALAIPAAVNPTRTSLTNGDDWPKSTGRTQRRTLLTSPIPGYPCSTSSW